MIRVLLVDDSAAVRQVLERMLRPDPEIKVIGTAPDPYVARTMILDQKPDVVTLDIHMPKMDGVTFLQKLKRYHPLPVIVISSLTPEGSPMAAAALCHGAVDVLCKPGVNSTTGDFRGELIAKIKAAARVNMAASSMGARLASKAACATELSRTTNIVLAIGASMGGTTAIEVILRFLPPNAPGTVIAMHLPQHVTKIFANRLNDLSQIEVREAVDGDSVVSGVALIAPGDRHLMLRRSDAYYSVQISDGPRVNHYRPSIDVMFRSVAQSAGNHAIGAILTGMGADGANGLLAMKEVGAATIAQDEESCVIFGMPKQAIKLDAANYVLPLSQIGQKVLTLIKDGDQIAQPSIKG